MNPDLIAEIRAALEIIGNWKIGPPGGRTGFGKHFRYIYSDGISIRVSGDNSNVVAESVFALRNHAPALLDEIERLRARVAELEAERASMRRDPCDSCKHFGTRHNAPPCNGCIADVEWLWEPTEDAK